SSTSSWTSRTRCWTRGFAMRDTEPRIPTTVEPIPVEMEPSEAAEGVEYEGRMEALTTRQIAWRRFKRHRPAMVSMFVLGILTLVTILAPFLPLQNPQKLDLIGSLQGP